MTQKLTPKNLVKQFKSEMFETTVTKELSDNGFRMRQSTTAKDFGDNVWELATTYYYTSQNSTARLFDEFQKFAAQHGYEATAQSWHSGKPIEVSKDTIVFESNPWPRLSWAKILVIIVEKIG